MARCDVYRSRTFEEIIEISSFLGSDQLKQLVHDFKDNLKKKRKQAKTPGNQERTLQPRDLLLDKVASEYTEDQIVFTTDSQGVTQVVAGTIDCLIEVLYRPRDFLCIHVILIYFSC